VWWTNRVVRASFVHDSGFRFRVQGSGFRVQGSGFRVSGFVDQEGCEGKLSQHFEPFEPPVIHLRNGMGIFDCCCVQKAPSTTVISRALRTTSSPPVISKGLGFRAYGLWFRVWGMGFRV
jgi:hypothetical protein